jgi:predicted RND superfamily exporter protein
MDTVGIIMLVGVGIVLGIYITSQISEHIDHKTRHKQFLENLEKFDKQEKDDNGTRKA